MKLRIRDNSIRLRLERGEVDALRTERVVRAAVPFPDRAELHYMCKAVPRLASPIASFDGRAITVSLPLSEVETWADTEQVSISAEVALGDDRLSILVEKDFACLAPREGEDESDMFAHPLAGKEQC